MKSEVYKCTDRYMELMSMTAIKSGIADCTYNFVRYSDGWGLVRNPGGRKPQPRNGHNHVAGEDDTFAYCAEKA